MVGPAVAPPGSIRPQGQGAPDLDAALVVHQDLELLRRSADIADSERAGPAVWDRCGIRATSRDVGVADDDQHASSCIVVAHNRLLGYRAA